MDDDCGTRFLVQLYRICFSFLCHLFGSRDFALPSVDAWLLAHGRYVWCLDIPLQPGQLLRFSLGLIRSHTVFDGAKQQP